MQEVDPGARAVQADTSAPVICCNGGQVVDPPVVGVHVGKRVHTPPEVHVATLAVPVVPAPQDTLHFAFTAVLAGQRDPL